MRERLRAASMAAAVSRAHFAGLSSLGTVNLAKGVPDSVTMRDSPRRTKSMAGSSAATPSSAARARDCVGTGLDIEIGDAFVPDGEGIGAGMHGEGARLSGSGPGTRTGAEQQQRKAGGGDPPGGCLDVGERREPTRVKHSRALDIGRGSGNPLSTYNAAIPVVNQSRHRSNRRDFRRVQRRLRPLCGLPRACGRRLGPP